LVAFLVSWTFRHAQVAQLVEHATENRSVGGSIPPLGTTFCNILNKTANLRMPSQGLAIR
jgi:hypothetical protein